MLLLLFTAIAFSCGYFTVAPNSERDYLLRSDEKVIAWDKMVVANEFFNADIDGDD